MGRVVHAPWCHEDANGAWAGDAGARHSRSRQGRAQALGDWGLAADPDPRGRAGVLPARPAPEEPPRRPAALRCSVCPSVLLEHPHCSHTSVPTPGPEPCGQGLPLICGAREHPCRGRTLPEAERGFHLPASCCNHQIIWGWREACAHVCVHLAWAVSLQARGDMALGQGQMAR